MAGSRGFFLTNRVADPVLRPLLRTAAGRWLGRSLLLMRYHGRRTGRPHEVVVQYARSGPTVWVLVEQADRTTWWHNLQAPAEVDLWLAGERFRARAVAVVGADQPADARRGLTAYLARRPGAVRAVGLRSKADPDAVGEAAAGVVLVRADLHPEPDEAA
jgi:deazaflavin-dependent oxidoreductase (nitroreductase family)